MPSSLDEDRLSADRR